LTTSYQARTGNHLSSTDRELPSARSEFVEAETVVDLLRRQIKVLDVRAEVEFQQGALPYAQNFPILVDAERAFVGTCYKKKGSAAAVELGHELVSGDLKNSRVETWLHFLRENPESVITCWRGGLRSQLAQQWCLEAGLARPRIQGGYKALRQVLSDSSMAQVSQQSWLVLGGLTGVGKSRLLSRFRKLKMPNFSALDLEFLAKHRGSAFGAIDGPQPSQSTFENALFAEILNSAENVLVEDESRSIGHVAMPDFAFQKLRQSKLVLLEESVEVRTQITFEDYIQQNQAPPLDFFRAAFLRIGKKLGGERLKRVQDIFEQAVLEGATRGDTSLHREWIRILLVEYYDPMYLSSLDKRSPAILFRGSADAVLDFLRTGPSASS
jgi:tRNA 2-selenouridine synthase